MMRWITLLTAAIVLSGCVTTREVVYREPYAADGYYAQDPAYYRQGDSYYAPAYSGHGDYYFGASYGGGYGASYFDYPVYYSVFWPINRWYYDPFAYPGYYYGVTWFPRSYFSLSMSYGGGWRSHGWLSYSPYRYSWVDSYYDWRPWYDRYPSYRRHYPTPRYGDARVEASRLADLRRPAPRTQYYSGGNRIQNAGGAVPSYRGNRAADYYGSPRDGVRRVGAGAPRATPETGAFGNPTRGAPGGSRIQGTPRSQIPGASTGTGSSRNEVGRFSGQRNTPLPRGTTGAPSISERQAQDRRGYDLPGTRPAPRARTPDTGIPIRGMQPTPQVRELAPTTAPAPVRGGIQSRPAIRETPPVRTVAPVLETAPVRQVLPVRGTTPQVRPVPSYTPAPVAPAPVVRSAPVRSAPAPSHAAPAAVPVPRPAPVESRSEGSSQRGDSSETRRVGSGRNR